MRIAAGLSISIPFIEFPSKRVKQFITGNGNASKEQVMKMLQMIKLIDKTPKYLDTWCWMDWFLGILFSFIGLFKKSRGFVVAGCIISVIDLIILVFSIRAIITVPCS